MRRKVVRSEVAAPPIASFKSEGGRSFSVGSGTHWERYPGDPLWSDTFLIFFEGSEAGKLFRNLNYGLTDKGLPYWSASPSTLRWTRAKDAPTGLGFDATALETAEEALVAWGRSADELLDWSEGKPVRSMYSKTGVFQKKASES